MTGARVAIVKSAGRADAIANAVRELGHVPVLVSPFRVEEHEDALVELTSALSRPVTWLAVTSPHAAVGALASVARKPMRVAAVGAGTASTLQTLGFVIDVVGESGAATLAEKMLAAGLRPGEVVLHARGEDARSELRRAIESAGAVYVPVVMYRMVRDPVGERAAHGDFAAVIVGSPNLAHRAAELFPSRPPVIAIGRTTASALRDLGWPAAAVAGAPTPEDAAAALARVLGG